MDTVMDPNLEDFYRRIARVQKAHARGYGFEADGTIGRSHYNRPARRRFPFFRAALVVVTCVIVLKATILHNIGPEIYGQRVAELVASDGIDRLGGFIMTADPATVWVADKIATYIAPLL